MYHKPEDSIIDEQIRALFDYLSDKQRCLLVCHYVLGFTFGQLAIMDKVSREAINGKIKSVRKRFIQFKKYSDLLDFFKS